MAAKIYRGASVEGWDYSAVFGVGGSNTPNLIGGQVYAADEKIAI
jgi:hypothetical protein